MESLGTENAVVIFCSILTLFTSLFVAWRSNENNKKVENIKHEFDQNLIKLQKNFDKQFESKVLLWNTLSELEVHINKLWSSNNEFQRREAKKMLELAKLELRKCQIFIESDLYYDIKVTLNIFNEYLNTKNTLRIDEVYNNYPMRSKLIANNANYKEMYQDMLEQLKTYILD